MMLFHGTTNKKAIKKEGFRGSVLHSVELDSNTKAGDFDDNGVVFVTDSEELAAEYGKVIKLDAPESVVNFFRICPVTGEKEFFINLSDMEEVAIYF